MQPSAELLSIIESRDLGYHEACAFIALEAGDLEIATFHIERKRALQTSVRPERPALPAPPSGRQGRGTPPKAIEAIPDFPTVTHGTDKLKRGERRTCARCQKPKGPTAFKRGSDFCNKCVKENGGKKPRRVKRRATKPDNVAPGPRAGRSLDKTPKRHGRPRKDATPDNPPAQSPGANPDRRERIGDVFTSARVAPRTPAPVNVDVGPTRICKKCDRKFRITAFPNNGDICRLCTPNPLGDDIDNSAGEGEEE